MAWLLTASAARQRLVVNRHALEFSRWLLRWIRLIIEKPTKKNHQVKTTQLSSFQQGGGAHHFLYKLYSLVNQRDGRIVYFFS